MDASIILAGQQPNFMASIGNAAQAASAVNGVRQQNALLNVQRQHGVGIANGDPTSLNALAAVDPRQALEIRQAQQGMQQQQQGMQFDAEKMDLIRKDAAMKAQEYARGLSAEQRAAEAQKLTSILNGANHFYKGGDEAGYQQFLQQQGVDPAQYPFQQFPAYAVAAGAVVETLSAGDFTKGAPSDTMWNDPANPQAGVSPIPGVQSDPTKGAPSGYVWADPANPGAGVSPLPGFERAPADEYQRYVAEESAAGRQPLDRLSFAQAQKGKGVEMTMPDGTRVVVGGPSGDERMKPSDPSLMIATIDGILNDPAFDVSTGILAPLQNIPGTPQRRFGSRVNQLNGQAFLQAFESLKGAGQITEVEGTKATQAIGRLDSAQSPEDYRQALMELKEILTTAQARPPGWVSSQVGQQPQQQGMQPGATAQPPQSRGRNRTSQAPAQIRDDTDYDALPSGAEYIGPDGQLRRKR